MQLYDIQEPGQQIEEDTGYKKIIGIDLGTTNSLVSFEGNILSDKHSNQITPSVVSYDSNGGIEVGYGAIPKANAIHSVKTLMGRYKDDVQSNNRQISIKGDKIYLEVSPGVFKTPMEISSEILKHLKSIAEENIGEEISDAVISVPAYFDENQRWETKQAARIAGLNVRRLINEPTAAAFAYGVDEGAKDGSLYLVYDFGGGTFDVSILRMTGGIFHVIATGGDSNLGGDDIDRAIASNILQDEVALEVQSRDEHISRKIIMKAREIKEQISRQNTWGGKIASKDCTLVASDLNSCIKDIINKTMRIAKNVIHDADLSMQDIDDIILVGGSSRLPVITDKISKLFNKNPVCDIDPDKVVCLGAGMQGHALSGAGKGLLIDVTPLSLGIETAGGGVEVLIPRNSAIPTKKIESFTNAAEMQTAFDIHVLQGESNEASKCRSLGRFKLSGIRKDDEKNIKVEVLFQIDADGLLTVSAYVPATGATKEIEVRPSYGLQESDIMKILKASND